LKNPFFFFDSPVRSGLNFIFLCDGHIPTRERSKRLRLFLKRRVDLSNEGCSMAEINSFAYSRSLRSSFPFHGFVYVRFFWRVFYWAHLCAKGMYIGVQEFCLGNRLPPPFPLAIFPGRPLCVGCLSWEAHGHVSAGCIPTIILEGGSSPSPMTNTPTYPFTSIFQSSPYLLH